MTWDIQHDGSKKPWNLKFCALFAAIQLTAFVLQVVGFALLAVAANAKFYQETDSRLHWKSKFLWLWDNQEDGICPSWYGPITRWNVFKWAALRNSVNNLRYIKGVSDPSYPVLWAEGTINKKPMRLIVGWNHSGYPTVYIKSAVGDSW